ncbi:MAG: 50S ribosomal protein L25 [Candidatus Omnitrophica bacterium]|nr:50S ribosomal protein L25 [Candidatus Omnitrophota bacterium]
MSPRQPTHPAERPVIVARLRQETGSRAVGRLRRAGLIPGVLYGKATPATSIVINRRDLLKTLHATAGEHGLMTLRVETDQAASKPVAPMEKPVLIKHVEHDPVLGEIRHIDFQAIVLTEQLRVKISVVLSGQPIGVKQDGGVLEHFLREIEVECLPTAIPKQIEHDISALKIGDTIHVRELTVPAGARITADPEGVVASVLAPKAEKVEEVTEAAAEPEVIREKKPEAEAEGEATAKKDEKKDEKKKEEK